tara:strand:+ start:384 stop:902 length:519 start_codon:yes stop_codon:yes gene_type:complete
MSKNIELIVARDIKYGIGLDGKIPWRCLEDMQHFRRTTTTTKDPTKQNAVIMGRKTWNSLRKPLENRVNICLSSSPQTIPTFATMEAAIAYANNDLMIETIFIIGGVQVYREALDTLDVDYIWVTVIKREFPTDRDVRFMRKYLKNRYFTVIRYTDEYCIWKYERSKIQSII